MTYGLGEAETVSHRDSQATAPLVFVESAGLLTFLGNTACCCTAACERHENRMRAARRSRSDFPMRAGEALGTKIA